MNVDVLAYAKLNLSLRILGRRRDGYHEILSEMQTIDLADRLEIALDDGGGIRVESPLGLGDQDLVARAAAALLAHKRVDRGVRIRVKKAIPVGAGLGGGSSDAAATLSVLDRMTPPRLGWETLCALGAALGSDVPLFVYGGRARVRGRGEQVEPLKASRAVWYVVLVPPVRCATAAVYAEWDRMGDAARRADRSEPRRGENDLLAAALEAYPALQPYHEAVAELAAESRGMSGSGSALYAAYGEPEPAERARRLLQERFGTAEVSVCRPTDVGHITREEYEDRH